MDVAKTIAFIRRTQARTDRRLRALRKRQLRDDARGGGFEKRMDRFDKRLDEIWKLVRTAQQLGRENKIALRELAREQKRTRCRFRSLLG